MVLSRPPMQNTGATGFGRLNLIRTSLAGTCIGSRSSQKSANPRFPTSLKSPFQRLRKAGVNWNKPAMAGSGEAPDCAAGSAGSAKWVRNALSLRSCQEVQESAATPRGNPGCHRERSPKDPPTWPYRNDPLETLDQTDPLATCIPACGFPSTSGLSHPRAKWKGWRLRLTMDIPVKGPCQSAGRFFGPYAPGAPARKTSPTIVIWAELRRDHVISELPLWVRFWWYLRFLKDPSTSPDWASPHH